MSHCPTVLGTSELSVSSFVNKTAIIAPSSGLRRGIVIYIHGLGGTPPNIPIPFVDLTGGILVSYPLTLATALAADGWVVAGVPYPDDFHPVSGPKGLQADITADAGHGLRYLNNTLRWWDHVVAWVHSTYGDWPIVVVGVSWGGWRAIQIAAAKAATLTAYVAHIPVTILSNLTVNYPPNFSTLGLDTSGLDAGAHALDAVTVPGLIGWGTNDGVVGYNASGTGGTPISNTTDIYNNAHAAGRPITSNAQPHSHDLNLTDVSVMTDPTTGWFATTVDPLAPKAF